MQVISWLLPWLANSKAAVGPFPPQAMQCQQLPECKPRA